MDMWYGTVRSWASAWCDEECVYIFQGRYLRFPDALKTTALVGNLCYEETQSLRLFAGCGHVVWDAGKLGVGSVR